MRTRHILTALALPALFAACTADEFESANFEQGLQERAKLSKDFVLKTGNSVDTRYAVEGDAGISFTYEQGKDNIGAAIIDQYTPGDDPEDWKIIPSLAGNFPFAYQGGDEWKSDYELGVGHYMFVYPYNKSDNNRAAVKYELPVIQKMYETEDGPQVLNAAIEEGNKAVAVTLLREGETLADVSMKNLFTYPKVTINFDNGEKVTTVSQVVLKADAGYEFIVKGGFDHKRVAALFGWNSEYTGFSGADDFWTSATKSVDWDKVDTYDFLLQTGGADEAYGKPETSDYIIVKFPNNTKVKLDANTQNKYVEARFMMPSVENFMTTNITMYVYTDNGIYDVDFEADSFSFKSTTSETAKKNALQRSRGNALTLKALNSTNNKNGGVDNIVTTVEDWNALVDTYGNTTVGQDIAIVGTDFAFNENVKMPSKSVFKINSDVAVDGEVTISNVTVNGTVTVEEGATLTTSGSFIANKVENNGIMNIAVVTKNGTVNLYRGVSEIENNGTLKVVKNAQAEFGLTNKKGAIVTNNGEITISGENDGKINNKAVIYIRKNQSFNNNEQDKEDDPMPTINNEGRIISQGTFTNDGTIMNNGEITCDAAVANATIVNGVNGLIDSAKDMITYITTNNGTIVVYEANPGSDIKVKNNGTIEYTASEASIDFTNSIVTDVIASKTFAIDKMGQIKNVTMTAGGKLTIPANTALTNLTVSGGTVELGSNIKVKEVLKVAKNARVTVPADKELYAVEMENEGSILVSDKFITEESQSAAGLVQAEGPQAEIKFSYDPNAEAGKEQLKKDYQTAMKAAVKAWASDSRTLGLTVNNLSYDLLNGKKGETTAKDLFGQYRDANLTTTEQVALTNAFNAYQAVVPTATILEYYTDAVKAIVAENEKATTFQTVVKSLTWTVTTGSDHIYEQTGNVSAETAALNAFKAAVAGGTITVTNVFDKVTLCTSSTNYAPACSQVFVTDVIYTIFSEDAIALTQDWTSLLGKRYATKGNFEGWSLQTVKEWINAVALSTESSLILDAAKKFITDNNLLSVSKSWTYDDKIIKAIVADQAYNK